jgi:hypothetical protein
MHTSIHSFLFASIFHINGKIYASYNNSKEKKLRKGKEEKLKCAFKAATKQKISRLEIETRKLKTLLFFANGTKTAESILFIERTFSFEIHSC